jgi:hypothetical protein
MAKKSHPALISPAVVMTVFISGCAITHATESDSLGASGEETVLTGSDWEQCAADYTDRLEAQGYAIWCGSSGSRGGCVAVAPGTSFEDGLLDLILRNCGYKPHTESEANTLTDRLRTEGRTIEILDEIETFPPDDPIHKVADEIAEQAGEQLRAQRERQRKNQAQLAQKREEGVRGRGFSVERVFSAGADFTNVVVRVERSGKLRCIAEGPAGRYVAVRDWIVQPPAEEIAIRTSGAVVAKVSCLWIE